MFRIIQETNPTWVVGENVPGLIDLALEDCFIDLEGAGYEVQPLIIPACGVGAPHRRDRVWILAHSKSKRCGEKRSNIQRPAEWVASSRNVPDTASEGLQNWGGASMGNAGEEVKEFKRRDSFHCRVQTIADPKSIGLQRERPKGQQVTSSYGEQGLSLCGCGYGIQWAIEPDVGRVAHGIPDRVDRLKGCGNSIVPQVVYPILQGIVEIEEAVT